MDGVLAVVTCFAGNFAPRNWTYCNGQLLPISQNQALFSLLGTAYGGDGISTFGLPDLRGRAPVSSGAGQNLTPYTLGQKSGNEAVTLTVNTIPSHAHTGNTFFRLQCDNTEAVSHEPDYNYPANSSSLQAFSDNSNTVMLAPPDYAGTVNNAGNGNPLAIRSPYLGLNYVICTNGIFPSRN